MSLSQNQPDESAAITTDVPARMDALPWSRWHLMVVVALGVTWVLDGLEVTLSGAVGNALRDPRALGLSETQIGLSGTAYLAGAVIGALIFGWATDRFGRKKLFFITLALYVGATAATAFSWSALSYFLFRASATGAGIGGEYAAINSAVDELIPARIRGHVDLLINSTFWLGAAAGSGMTAWLLNGNYFAPSLGWRFAFGTGAVLGLGILILRNAVPESPRAGPMTRQAGRRIKPGRRPDRSEGAADRKSEDAVQGEKTSADPHRQTTIHPRTHTPCREIAHTMLVEHRTRLLLGLALMII